MRVSLLNLNLDAKDAIGRYIMDKARYFLGRGDQVRIYAQFISPDIPGDLMPLVSPCTLSQLIGSQSEFAALREHFFSSDLYVYDYPNWYQLVDSIRNVDRGVVVLDYHGVTPPELWRVKEALDLLERSVEVLPEIVRHADYAIGHSAFTHGELVEKYGLDQDKAFHFPYAVPLDDLVPGEPDPKLVARYGLRGRKVLLYVGRMAYNKRIDLLIKAMPLIRQSCPEAKLLLVGDNASPVFAPIVKELESLVETLGLADSVVFTGRVEDLAAHYRLADLYVTSSLHEGFCVPLVESMAMGLPMVGSDMAAIPHTMGGAGLLCEPDNVEDLVAKVVTLLEDPDLALRLRERGFARAPEFSLVNLESRWDEVLDVALAYQPALSEVAMAAKVDEPAAPPEPDSAESPPQPPLAPLPAAASPLPDLEEHFAELEMAVDVSMHDYQVRSGAPVVGGLIVWARRNLTSHLKEPYVDPIIDRQVHANRRLVWSIRDIYNRMRELGGQVTHATAELKRSVEAWIAGVQESAESRDAELKAEQGLLREGLRSLESRVGELQAKGDELSSVRTAQESLLSNLAELQATIADLRTGEVLREEMAKELEGVAQRQRSLEKAEDRLADGQSAFDIRLAAIQASQVDLRAGLDKLQAERGAEASAREELAGRLIALQADVSLLGESGAAREDGGSGQLNYFLHADSVGGSAQALRAIYAPLVERFREAPDVIDLGCGSGVFLELLREAEIPAYGVDLDGDSLLLCEKKGLDVRKGDLVAHLRGLDSKSVGGIFMAHVIEHLSVEGIIEFVQLCYDKLIYGGPLVLVTPNGGALSIYYHTFYKDLTHNRPLHPDALRFLLQNSGFRRVEVSTISPMPDEFKLGLLNVDLAENDVQRQWAASINSNLERVNQIMFGDQDCVASGVK